MTERDSDAELAELRRDNARLHDEVRSLRSSLSWRVTGPLRRVANALRRGSMARLFEAQQQPVERPETASAAHLGTEVVMFALLPAAQAGGGQRSAQLARAYARRGSPVRYFYAAESFNFAQGAVEQLAAPPHLSRHAHVAQVSPHEAFSGVPEGSLVIFEAPHPRFVPFLEAAHAAGLRTVFELIDDWDTSLGADWYNDALQRRFVAGSTLVTGTAHVLREQLDTRFGRADALYLPNAADDAVFRPGSWPRPPEYAAGARALLYVGTLSGEWLSWEHLEAAGRVEGATVYLIGDLPHQRKLPPGVVSLGPRAITDVPRYLAHAHAALIPFSPGALTDAVSPIKVFEYLFMGRPVIATPMPELEGLPGVTQAARPDDFARACADAARPTEAERARFVACHSWAARAEALDVPVEQSITWFINGEGDVERAKFSLVQHLSAKAAVVASLAELPPVSTRFIGVLDARHALLAPASVRQLRHALALDAGARGARAVDGSVTLLRSSRVHDSAPLLTVPTTGVV